MDMVRTVSRSGKSDDKSDEGDGASRTAALTAAETSTVLIADEVAATHAHGNHATATNNNDSNNDLMDDGITLGAAVIVQESSTEREERKEAAGAVQDDETEASGIEVAEDGDDGTRPNHGLDIDENEDEDEEDEYEYEDDEDEANFAGFLVDQPALTATAAARSTWQDEPATIEEEEVVSPSAATATAAALPKWREPSREAVTMSLRAEQETSGSKRRLAQDLYRIMNKDTSETGFLLQPAVEDQMDKWKISLFQFDEDSMLAKDLRVLGLSSVELEMSFPDHYPFSPPFVRVVRPRFKRQTGFVMNGALCMELLTPDGWNPVNDIESVIVSIRSLLVVGEGRLEAAANLPPEKYQAQLENAAAAAAAAVGADDDAKPDAKRLRTNSAGDSSAAGYSVSEAKAAYEHLSSYHKKKGWDQSGWWARKG